MHREPNGATAKSKATHISQFCQFDALIKTVKKPNWWKNVHHSPFFLPLLILTMAEIRCPTVYTKGRKNRLAMGNGSIFSRSFFSFAFVISFHQRSYYPNLCHNSQSQATELKHHLIHFESLTLFYDAFHMTICVCGTESERVPWNCCVAWAIK